MPTRWSAPPTTRSAPATSSARSGCASAPDCCGSAIAAPSSIGPSVTTGEVRRTLDSRRFDDLAGTFEAVTYGGRPAEAPDADSARREWPRVLEETKRR